MSSKSKPKPKPTRAKAQAPAIPSAPKPRASVPGCLSIRDEIICELRGDGMTNPEIGAIIGISPERINNITHAAQNTDRRMYGSDLMTETVKKILRRRDIQNAGQISDIIQQILKTLESCGFDEVDPGKLVSMLEKLSTMQKQLVPVQQADSLRDLVAQADIVTNTRLREEIQAAMQGKRLETVTEPVNTEQTAPGHFEVRRSVDDVQGDDL